MDVKKIDTKKIDVNRATASIELLMRHLPKVVRREDVLEFRDVNKGTEAR